MKKEIDKIINKHFQTIAYSEKDKTQQLIDICKDVWNKAQKEAQTEVRKNIVKTLKNYKKFNTKQNILYSGNQQLDELLKVFNDDRFYK